MIYIWVDSVKYLTHGFFCRVLPVPVQLFILQHNNVWTHFWATWDPGKKTSNWIQEEKLDLALIHKYLPMQSDVWSIVTPECVVITENYLRLLRVYVQCKPLSKPVGCQSVLYESLCPSSRAEHYESYVAHTGTIWRHCVSRCCEISIFLLKPGQPLDGVCLLILRTIEHILHIRLSSSLFSPTSGNYVSSIICSLLAYQQPWFCRSCRVHICTYIYVFRSTNC